ncbi:MAG: hypothetical protein PWP23_208 [Candidatus Sumerlaeota bacterium]|nr:hypothetical protein [Candidatus Sumerlaeota bacterium]
MTANKSGKIVIIVLLALGIIAGLHFLVFRQRATEYMAAKSNYESIRNELNQLGKPKAWADIFRFEYETINREIQFYELLRDANLENPDPFAAVTTTPEESQAQKEEQLLILWDMLHELQAKNGGEAGTNLTFLNRTQSWNLLEEFPETVNQTGTAVSDLVRKLQDTDALLEQLTAESRLYQEQEFNYATQLYVIGLNILPPAQAQYLARINPRLAQTPPGLGNLRNRDQIKENVGELPSIFYTLNRIDLVKKEVPKEELGGLRTEMEYNRRLWDLFRLDWEDSVLFNLYKQSVALQDIVDLAIKHKVAEIRHVKMWDARDITWPPPEEEEDDAAADPTGMAGDEMNMDMMNFGMGDPSMMGDPMMMMMDPSMMMMGMPGGAPVVEEEKDIVATAVPIEIQLTASNSNMMAFLYELTHVRKTYAIDKIDLVALPQQEGLVGATIVVKVLSYYSPFGDIPANEMTPTRQEIHDAITSLEAKKREIATKPGASELAEAEGFAAPAPESPEPAAGNQPDASVTEAPSNP